MSTTTNGIFTFDHGQKMLNKAIGVQESYMDDLHAQIKETLKGFLFDENKEMKDDLSPSGLVEIVASEYSYSQLVIMSSFYLQDKIDGFVNKVEDLSRKMKTIQLDGDDLPKEVKDFLDSLTKSSQDGDGDDD